MSDATLLLSAAGSLLTAFLYIYIGQVLRGRKVGSEAKLANGMFILWWESLGGISLLGVGVMLAYIAQGDSLPQLWFYQTYVMFLLLVLFVALWGLQFYLVYLYTGSKRSFVPLGAFYALLYMGTIALIEWTWQTPYTVTDNGWQLTSTPQVQLGLWPGLAFVVLFVGPQVFAAAAYFRLFFKTKDRTQKYRIALITGSIIVWFGSSILGTAAQVSSDVSWQLLSRAIGIAGALVILAAYKPPRWVRNTYGIRSIDQDSPTGQPALG